MLATRLKESPALGEAVRRWPPDATEDERILLSLSAPASLSKAIEFRLWNENGSEGPPWDFGVLAPCGLLALEEPAEDVRRVSEVSETLRRAIAMDEGLPVELAGATLNSSSV